MKLLLKVLLATCLSWLFDGLVPPPPPDHVVVARNVEPEPGHGSFCAPVRGPAVFLGRDLPPSTTYARFEAWCEAEGGQLGWKE